MRWEEMGRPHYWGNSMPVRKGVGLRNSSAAQVTSSPARHEEPAAGELAEAEGDRDVHTPESLPRSGSNFSAYSITPPQTPRSPRRHAARQRSPGAAGPGRPGARSGFAPDADRRQAWQAGEGGFAWQEQGQTVTVSTRNLPTLLR